VVLVVLGLSNAGLGDSAADDVGGVVTVTVLSPG
jgi:hypothetical protein